MRLAESIPLGRLHPTVVERACRSKPAERWAIALSGGADSLALVLLLWAHFPERRERMVVLHFNHRLRGRAAAADARFCARACASLGLRFRSGEWANAPDSASEAAARAARHDFFAREMKRARATWLWLGHHQDDIVETMLMRLARGSGTAGLAAPRPMQIVGGVTRARPLLTLRKAELVAALTKAGIAWRDDSTNASDRFFRNRVRRSLVPAWTCMAGRDVIPGVALARERLDEDDTALEAWVDEIGPLDRWRRLDLVRLAGKPVALWRRALHRWLLAARIDSDLSRQGFDQLLAAIRRGRDTRFSLGARNFAVVRAGKLKRERS